MPSVELTDNLTLVVKGGAVQLSPTQSFRLAQRLLQGATRSIVRTEAAEAANDASVRCPAPGAS
jgi:hypothetical protein